MSTTREAEPAAAEPRRRNRLAEFTERDGAALRWLGEQYGARMDVLGVLLGRLGGGEPLSRRGARNQVDRWRRAELVRVERALGESWVTPTRKGLDRVGLDLASWAVPVTRVRHCHAVNVVRLWWESSPAGEVSPWVCERLTWKERGQMTWHVPDGVVRDPKNTPDGPVRHIAIEVELTHKSRRVLTDEVFTKFRAGTEAIAYYVPDEHFAERMRADIVAVQKDIGSEKRWSVGLLPEVAGVTYMQSGR